MSFLLDTTALSELTKRTPNAGYLRWLDAHATDETFIGAPSIGELEYCICLMPQSKKRRSLERWLETLTSEFEDRVLPYDVAAARIWGRTVAAARRLGRSLPSTDSQIAAIAIVHGICIVTRNVRHCSGDGFENLKISNPWT